MIQIAVFNSILKHKHRHTPPNREKNTISDEEKLNWRRARKIDFPSQRPLWAP